jgi:hypothetical protein
LTDPSAPVSRDVYELSQQMSCRLDAFEESFGARMDKFEEKISGDVQAMKETCACKSRKCDEEFDELHTAIDGEEGVPGLKERVVKIEGTLAWQWVAVGAAFAFAAFLETQIWGHVTKLIVGG